jgi:hypothetical protein
MLRYLQALDFEINRTCPLARLHAGLCPISDPHRYDHVANRSRTINMDVVQLCARAAYGKMLFRGWVQFHYFNDPGDAIDAICTGIPGLRDAVPGIRLGLFTNGEMFGSDLSKLRMFDGVWIRNYRQARNWHRDTAGIPGVRIGDLPNLDSRMTTPPAAEPLLTRCRRMWDELAIDHYGYGHICTGDWRRQVDIGNVFDDGFDAVCQRFNAVRDLICQEPMPPEAPKFCRYCQLSMRVGDCIIDQRIFDDIVKHRGF